MSLVRINKAIADAGICSRRKADELIAAGRVSLNGCVVQELGTRVNLETDTVTVDGSPLSLSASKEKKYTYVLLHKPIQVVSTAHDPEGRKTVLDLLPEELKKKRLYPVGRLDYFSEGMLLLTDDGELTHKLTHPRYELPKVYEVHVREVPTKGMLRTMRQGMTLAEGEVLAPVDVEVSKDQPKILLLTLQQGINRQIRRMCRDLKLTILLLRRVKIGEISLGLLPKGECRPLTLQEVAYLQSVTAK